MKLSKFILKGLKTGTLFWVSSDVNNRTADIWLPYSQNYPFDYRVRDTVNWITKLKLDLSFLYFDEPVISRFFDNESFSL